MLFDWPASLGGFGSHFLTSAPPWAWLDAIARALEGLPSRLPATLPAAVHVDGPVHLCDGVRLPPACVIVGPAWIGPGSEIRPGAYIRGNVIAGAGCVLGHACEFKNCLLLDGAQVPHFSYVGDSILGNRAHLGAGVVCSNLRLDQGPVSVRTPAGLVPTGRRKVGAFLGDGAEVGCNAVLNPGAILGRRSFVLPATAFSGTLAPGMIARPRGEPLPRRD